MHSWLRNSLIVGGTFAVVWIATVYSWRAGNRLPSTIDVAENFLVIPLALLASFWLLAHAGQLVFQKFTLSKAKASNGATSAVEYANAGKAAQEQYLSLAIMATAVRTLHGDTTEELLENLIQQAGSFELDTELVDSNGFAILSGRIKNVDASLADNPFIIWEAAQQYPDLLWSEEQLRSIMLATEVLVELGQYVSQHAELETYQAIATAKRKPEFLPILEVVILLPASWRNEQVKAVQDFFAHCLERQGWPATRIHTKSICISDLSASFTAIDKLMLEPFCQPGTSFSLVIACDSNLGNKTLETWESLGKLSNSPTQVAYIPGEGAAGLLLSDQEHAKAFSQENKACIYRVAQGRHEQSTEHKSRITDQLMANLVQDALSASLLQAENISLILSDTDHQVGRLIELMAIGSKQFTELDPNGQFIKVTHACGNMGGVASLTAIALAYQHVINHAEPALCLSNLDKQTRAAVIVGPALEPAISPAPTHS
ncbi:MAG: hypothetical protein WC782_06200 [Methylococcaceae bacterium]|jgi:hypothetical protein